MSKKVFNVFSILCFALVLCFIGCTELINPKTETDINLNIDLSKIIKSSRNEGGSQGASSIGDNPTIKVAIYDAKDYDNATNSTENLTLITQAQASVGGDGIARVKLSDIPVGIYAIVFAELSFTDENSTQVVYAGNSGVFEVKASNNKKSLVLKKVANSESSPDDSKPEEIINAKEPKIIEQPMPCITINTELYYEPAKTYLTCTAKSIDGGNLSFMWYKSVDGINFYEFNSILGPSLSDDGSVKSSTTQIEANIGECFYFYCVVTNTNENATSNKVASVHSNTVQVACINGILSSISATYKSDSFELLGKDFTYSNVSVTETYTSSDGSTEPTIITVDADESRYKISPTYSENAIGYVPYTVTRKDSTPTEAIITVPVKYELDANNLVLETYFNSISVPKSDTDNKIKIPQYGTVKYSYQISDNYKISFIGENGENTEIEDINNTSYYTATIEDDKNQNIGSIASVGTYEYTVTLQSANEWFVCNTNTSKDFSVEVYPWKIVLTMIDGTAVDESNLSEKTSYRLSINNEAIPSGFNFSPYLESGSSNFLIQDYILTTPAAIETTQIIAKFDDQQIASITVTVGAMVGSVNNPIIAWDDLKNYLEISSEEPSTIYIQGNLYSNENAVVNRPVTIVPIGNVTITRTSEGDYIFKVIKNLELQGSDTNKITLAGNADVENTQPLISCVSDVNVNLNYCTLENANCGSNSNGSVLYASNGSSINMNCCVVQNSKGVPILLCNTGENKIVNTSFLNNASCINVNENANLVLDSCTFNNKTNSTYSGELSIYKANTITIKNTTFETVNSGYNIYAYVAPEVVLDDSLSIPSIYFDNSYSDSSLGIVCGEYLTLIDPQIPITITACCYDEMNDNTKVDINLFSLEDEKTVPDNIFTLANADYKINNTTGTIEKVSASGGVSDLVGTYVSNETELSNAILNTNTDTIIIDDNFTITESITIERDITIAANKEVTLTDSVTDDSCFWVTTGNLTLGGGSGNLTITSDTRNSTIQTGASNNGKTITVRNNVTFSDCDFYCISLVAKYFLIIEGGSFINNNYVPINIANNTTAEIKMTSGTITGNNYSEKGSSFYLNSGILTITGGTIKDNKINDTSCGASIWVGSKATATVNGQPLTPNAQYKDNIEQ